MIFLKRTADDSGRVWILAARPDLPDPIEIAKPSLFILGMEYIRLNLKNDGMAFRWESGLRTRFVDASIPILVPDQMATSLSLLPLSSSRLLERPLLPSAATPGTFHHGKI